MLDVAVIFPGQGAQFVGMGNEFYESSPQAKAVFDQADEIFGNGLLDVVFNGPQEKLTETAYCQPGIVAFSVGALEALKAHPSAQNINIKFAAGLSLGEYSALAASWALSFEDTIRLVQKRSAFMGEATQLNKGGMAAIIGLDKETIVKVCEEEGAEVANFNSSQQIVITGHADKVIAASAKLKEAGARNVVALDVAGAFHSTLMQSAADKFGPELENMSFAQAGTPIISNVDGQPASDPVQIKQNLAAQITSSVQWVDSIQYMAGQGVSTFLEIGLGKVLKGLLRKIDSSLKCVNIGVPEDIDSLI